MHGIETVSFHALQRYRERVDPAASLWDAERAIRELSGSARVRSRPRHWMGTQGVRPGARYLYPASRPGVCLVVVDRTVVTVFSRAKCAAWVRHRENRTGRRKRWGRGRRARDMARRWA